MKKHLHSFRSMFLKKDFIFPTLNNLGRKKISLLALLILSMSAFNKPFAQNFIVDDGNEHFVAYDGSYQDFVIPNNPLIVKITFRIKGGDGGKASVSLGETVPLIGFEVIRTCTSNGGEGASLVATFRVGTGPGKIPHGSTVRFIVGNQGENGHDNAHVVSESGTGFDYGGGGGGTAVLYQSPGSSSWILLGVAGGGGGAAEHMIAGVCPFSQTGEGGRSGRDGGDGNDILPGPGFKGPGGVNGDNGRVLPPYYAGGGGGRGSSDQFSHIPCLNVSDQSINYVGEGGFGNNNNSEGGYGGSSEGCISLINDWRNGGFGYGGGGAGRGGGGGGGGYSGGGAGALFSRGGGGGSFVLLTSIFSDITNGGNTESPSSGGARYEVKLNQPPVAECKSITVYLDANGLASISSSDVDNGSSDPDGDPLTFSLSKSSFTCADLGENTVTLTVTDDEDASSSCEAIVTVVDNLAPVITCPAGITVSCAAEVPPVNTASVTTTDNCPVTVTHTGDVITNQTCVNRFTLTRTYMVKDASGNEASCTQVIIVNDNLAPVISNLTVSPSSLWPPNHKMHDITVNYHLTDNCISSPSSSLSVTSNEPVNGTGDGDTAPDWSITNNHSVKVRAERAGNGNGRIYTITVSSNDGCNPTSTATATVKVPKSNNQKRPGQPDLITSNPNSKDFSIGAFPNPATNGFYISISESEAEEKVLLQVFDITGRLVETKQNVIGGSTIQVGSNYRPGVYLLRAIQGDVHRELRLVKLSD
ncbi:MAG: T9SS type A sorting domain-containing protein [Chitinophagaceae bacterium]